MTNLTRKFLSTMIPVALALVGFLGGPQEAQAISAYVTMCDGPGCASLAPKSPDAAGIAKAYKDLQNRKKNELKHAYDCSIGGIWIYDPNPARMGYCLRTSPQENRINDCNLNIGIWIYGEPSKYPALDRELGLPYDPDGYCYGIAKPDIKTPGPIKPNGAINNEDDMSIQCAMNPKGMFCN